LSLLRKGSALKRRMTAISMGNPAREKAKEEGGDGGAGIKSKADGVVLGKGLLKLLGLS